MIENSSVKQLKGQKNLLAFSGGVDSSALFFILLDAQIDFDIAIVNYHIREQSADEVAYAKELSQKYNKKIFILDAPDIKTNFEAKARETRYVFFEKIIKENNYKNLITAHHLADRFEWMLMQFCKGAGCIEMSGMQKIQQREFYTLTRPLLHLDKKELYEYLEKNSIKYFEDKSNDDTQIKRNFFRHNHTRPLLDKYLSGIKKSFEYIDADREILTEDVKINKIDDFTYFKSLTKRADIYNIDKVLKSEYIYMLSKHERELLKKSDTLVAGRKFLITKHNGYILIAPYIKNTKAMQKEFKELCRELKIEPKLRAYLHMNREVFDTLLSLEHISS